MSYEKKYLVDLIRQEPETAEMFMGELMDTFMTHLRMLDALEKLINKSRDEKNDTKIILDEYLKDIHAAVKLHGRV